MKVFIPAAGVGSRLGEETKYLNKALVTVGSKPAISHIIERFPVDVQFIIALGYKGHCLREFLEVAYPCRNFEFISVFPFEGPGSSMGLTLRCAKSALHSAF